MRWIVLGMLLAVTSINYLDRLLLSVLAPVLRDTFHFSESLYGNISGAFQIAYAIGFLVLGRMIDRFGTKRGLAVAATAWSMASALHATVMAVLERRLHTGELSGSLANLPPLLTMERTLFRIIWIGFVLLTVTLASGILFSETLFGKPLAFDYKTLYKLGFGLLSWVIFAALLTGRHAYGWRGRRALRWTLAGFIALMLAYVGTRFVLEVILGRP